MRKDIEGSFEVLTERFQILNNGMCLWKHYYIITISECCVILHNLNVSMSKYSALTNETDESMTAVDLVMDGMLHFNINSNLEIQNHLTHIDVERLTHLFFTRMNLISCIVTT